MKNLVVCLMVGLFSLSAQAFDKPFIFKGDILKAKEFRREATLNYIKYFKSMEEAEEYAEALVGEISSGNITRQMVTMSHGVEKEKSCSLDLPKVNAWLAKGNGEVSADLDVKEVGNTKYEDGAWSSKTSYLMRLEVTVPCYKEDK